MKENARFLVVAALLATLVQGSAWGQGTPTPPGTPCSVSNSRCRRDLYTPTEFNGCKGGGRGNVPCSGTCEKPSAGTQYKDLCVSELNSTCSGTARSITITNGQQADCTSSGMGRFCACPEGSYAPWSGTISVISC